MLKILKDNQISYRVDTCQELWDSCESDQRGLVEFHTKLDDNSLIQWDLYHGLPRRRKQISHWKPRSHSPDIWNDWATARSKTDFPLCLRLLINSNFNMWLQWKQFNVFLMYTTESNKKIYIKSLREFINRVPIFVLNSGTPLISECNNLIRYLLHCK